MPEQHLLKDGGKLFELASVIVAEIYAAGGGDEDVRSILSPNNPARKNIALLVLGVLRHNHSPYIIAVTAKSEKLRAVAVQTINHCDSLKKIALLPEPGWSAVRVAAVEKIASMDLSSRDEESWRQETLKEIALDYDRGAAEAATLKLTNLNNVFDVVRYASHRSTRFEAIKRLDEARLVRVVQSNARDPEFKIAAIKRMEDANVLYDLSITNITVGVRRAAELRLLELRKATRDLCAHE